MTEDYVLISCFLVENIKTYEEWERENAKKVILAHRRSRKNSELTESLPLLRKNLMKVTQLPHSVTDSDARVRYSKKNSTSQYLIICRNGSTK